MEIFYHFDCSYPSVYLINGVFFESVSKLKSEQGDSLYITVLPLDAVYLPYTVRLGGGEVFANSALTVVYKLRNNRFYVRFLPRFNYVYSPVRHEPKKRGGGAVRRLFEAVKEGETAKARAILTPALSASIDDNSLLKFFDGYRDLVENDGYVIGEPDTFFLIPDDDGETASFFRAQFKSGLIDDITEI